MSFSNRHLDSGSVGLVLAGIIAAVSLFVSGISLAHSWLHLEVRTQLIADLAALAAADTMTGIIAGVPCENAREIALGNGASLESCRIVSQVVSVRVGKEHLMFEVVASADARALGSM